MFDSLKNKIFDSPVFRSLIDADKDVIFSGLQGSLLSLLIHYIQQNLNCKVIYISTSLERIYRLRGDLDILGTTDNLSVFSSDKNNESEEFSKTLDILTNSSEFAVLIHSDELGKNVIKKDFYCGSLIKLEKGKEFLFEELLEKLNEFGFQKKDFVDETGDYSVRGGIVDVFPEHFDSPVRIEFFGETVESIREFDITSQRSLKEIPEISFGINIRKDDENYAEFNSDTIKDYIPDDSLMIFDNYDSENPYVDFDSFDCSRRIFVSMFRESEYGCIDFDSRTQPDFHSNIKQVCRNLAELLTSGFEIHLMSSDTHQSERLKSLLEDGEEELIIEGEINTKISDRINYYDSSLQEGFVFPHSKIAVYTEHQIFSRYFRQVRKRPRKFRGMTFDEVKELKPGDFVVHRDFGVGIYSGLKKIKVGNSIQEVAKLSYAGGDIIFLNLNYVNLINKYSAGEGITPKLTRLGGGEWAKIKDKAKNRIKDIARDLILLYAKRKSEKGYSFSQDTHWQKELEASFIYEDTPDQYKATEDVKNDMMSENPMDRLVCGDVGFGKTEVAVRAAFKAVLDNKQVAVLVPTTILAVQHYNTFRDRLAPFAVDVRVISRMQSKKETIETLKDLKEGKVNILIGTHRILSKDILFRDLGLLVIDEEQRFGVKAKEKLRAVKPNIDTLTLTATPIPRTLNFSLLGARDLSVINTPPKNRKTIITEIIRFNWNVISDVIKKELDRNGQVYFVNDKIDKLYDLAERIKEYLPYARVGIAHGQMTGSELEDVIVDFIEKKLNVLFCTKIIESGLDIPNVNTIIINNANMYGLAELYQLRGRVGRSDIQAYAYFISPPEGSLTKTAIRRLQAIEEYTELGSGFNLAMRDMEIRGVGNMLGKDQSGFVNQMGFELFIDIIDEAVSELKENEFKDLFREETALKKLGDRIKKKDEYISTIIENDFNAFIPEDYIENDTERLNIYKRLYEVPDGVKLKLMQDELSDRFGKLPVETENLIKVVEIKLRATEIGLEKINVNGREMMLFFPPEKEHRIFQSDFFGNLVSRLSSAKNNKYSFINNKKRLIIQIIIDSESDSERLEEIKKLLNDLLLGV